MTLDRELWAIALMVERDQGVDGPRHIAERIGAAAIAGDWGGVALEGSSRPVRSTWQRDCLPCLAGDC